MITPGFSGNLAFWYQAEPWPRAPAKDDGTGDILTTQRLRWSRILGAWRLPRTRDQIANTPGNIGVASDALRAAGETVEVSIDDTRAIPPPPVEADQDQRSTGRDQQIGQSQILSLRKDHELVTIGHFFSIRRVG